MVSAEQLEFKLEMFEGPLDLLLHLIRKNKVSITDIPIVEILSQYMEYLNAYEENNIEISSEFLVIASQLVYIKSKILLPRQNLEEEDDPRAELVNALIEYQKYKMISMQFSDMSATGFNSYSKQAEQIEKDSTYTYSHIPEQLFESFMEIFQRKQDQLPPPASSFTEYVIRRNYSVNEKIIYILDFFKKKNRIEFMSLFENTKSISEVVVTFLAVLELCKNNRITIEQNGRDFTLTLNAGGEQLSGA